VHGPTIVLSNPLSVKGIDVVSSIRPPVRRGGAELNFGVNKQQFSSLYL
jgi:hypothetical protein